MRKRTHCRPSPRTIGLLAATFAVIVGNPPYAAEADIEILVDEPRMMSNGLRLDRVYRQGVVLTQEATIPDVSNTVLDMGDIEEFHWQLVVMTCGDPTGGEHLENGGIAAIVVRDIDGELVSELQVTQDSCGYLAIRKEAQAALVRLAVNQERYYVINDTYTGDLRDLGFLADPFTTESGLYTISIVPGANRERFLAVARYNGQGFERERCREFSISATMERHSAPLNDCWK